MSTADPAVPRTAQATAAASLAARRHAAVLERIASGAVSIAALLLDDATADDRACLSAATISRLLRALPGVGPSTVTVVCRRARVDRGAKLGDLDIGRRRRLAEAAGTFDVGDYRGSGPLRQGGDGE